MIDLTEAPTAADPAHIGDREIVDVVPHRGVGIAAICALDLGHDHADMRHNDDMSVGVFSDDMINRCACARRDSIPAFTARRG